MDLVARHRRGLVLARTLCALVALAAGFVGILMLVAPASTGRYFSWPLGPAPLAALVGGCYVASALVFGGAAAREQWPGLRGLCVAVFGLTLPTLAATARHHDVFDFSRWQALAWVVLFVASPTLFGLTLYLLRGSAPGRGPRLRPWARTVLAMLATGYAALAIALWAWPSTIGRHGPFAVAGLGARFAGSWAAFLAIAAGYAAVRARWEETRVPVLALTVWPACVLGAAVLRVDDLRSGAARPAYLAALAGLALIAGTVQAAGRERAAAAQAALDAALAVPA